MTMGPIESGKRASRRRAWPVVVLAALLAGSGATAQGVADVTAPRTYSATELDELVGPVALYVDDLVAIVLAASAYPLQVVEAERFLDARQTDPSLEPDETWDDAIVALLNYPEVLRMMSEDLRWTADLGEAYVYQPSDVLEALQRFRERARALGSFDSDERQIVSESNGAIAVTPADPQVIYVPYYEPAQVVSYGGLSSLSYYPYGYPAYHYPYPIGYSFSSGYFWGVTTAYVIGWNTHRVHAYPRGCDDHPYRWYRYHEPYYTRHDARPQWNRQRGDYVWVPGDRFRPRQDPRRERDHDGERNWRRDDTQRTMTAENRRSVRTPPPASSLANSATTFARRAQADRNPMVARPVADTLRARAPAATSTPARTQVRPAPPVAQPGVSRTVRTARISPPAGSPRPQVSAPPPAPRNVVSAPPAAIRPPGPRGDAAVASGSRNRVER